MLGSLSWRTVRHGARFSDDEHERFVLASELDLHHAWLFTPKDHDLEITNGFANFDPIRESPIVV